MTINKTTFRLVPHPALTAGWRFTLSTLDPLPFSQLLPFVPACIVNLARCCSLLLLLLFMLLMLLFLLETEICPTRDLPIYH